MLFRLPDSANTTHLFINVGLIQRLYAAGPVSPPTDPTWLVRADLTTYGTVDIRTGLVQADAEAMAQEIAVALGIDWE